MAADLPLTCELSWDLFESLAALVETMAADGHYYHSLDLIPSISHPFFAIALSEAFNVLVQAELGDGDRVSGDRVSVSLSFDPETIATFAQTHLPKTTLSLRENNPQVQSQFTLRLMKLMASPPQNSTSPNSTSQRVSALEEQLQHQTQALKESLMASQSADRVKAEFLATMSHELRTPLTCIIGMAATLLRPQIQQHLPPHRQQAHLQIIRDRGQNLLALINDLLDLSKFEAGREMLRIRDFSFVQLASQTLRSFQSKAELKDIHLGFEVKTPEDNTNGRFYADSQRVRQILINLLSNALKFTPEGGSVTLRVVVEEAQAILQVQDTGIGIPSDRQAQIFLKFQQIDSSYQRKYEGTGLGLSLTELLVDLHGGKIQVDSVVDKGSCFTVFLPQQACPATTVGNQEQIPVTGPFYPRVLLVESQEMTANLICDLLTAADYQVIWMIDGDTALYQVDVIQPSVVIVDFGQADGPQALAKLHKHSRRANMRILAFVKDTIAWERARRIGADDYLIGPVIWPEELIDKVDSLIS